ETRDETENRRLSHTRRADDGRYLAGLDSEAHVLECERVTAITEAEVIELDAPLEWLCASRARKIPNATLDLQHFLDPLIPDSRLGARVGHLRKVPHRLIHLAQIQQKHDQYPGTQLPRQREPPTVAEHEASSDGHDDFHEGGQPGLE